MVKFLEEEEYQKEKKKLEESLGIDPTTFTEEVVGEKINWIEKKESWGDAKGVAKDIMSNEKGKRPIYIMYPKDKIKGKPQLVYQTKQQITLIRWRVSEDKQGNIMTTIRFFDDHYDKRYHGLMEWEWGLDFWVYRVIDNNKEYFVLSEKELPLKSCEIEGMNITMSDTAEMKKSMSLKSIGNIFFCKDFEPAAKILSKEAIVRLTKEKEVTEERWTNLLDHHELGTYNRFPKESSLLRSAHLLSGKSDGYPLHIAVMGSAGSRKSMGYIETIQQKFGEEYEIVEGANSRIKGLSPSFKEKPANIGYLARCERVGWIDELGKMVEFEVMKHQSKVTNVLGELNFLLDHKRRTVGSGNDNECTVQATAKFLFATNPVKGMDVIHKHVGLIDPTTMSRILWWVQDHEEMEMVMSEKGVEQIPPTHRQDYKTLEEEGSIHTKNLWGVSVCVGGNLSYDDFLTIFDTTNSFISRIDESEVQKLTKMVENLSREPMKGVWKPRGGHHVRLLIDGVVKHRCLFKDYDSEFKATKEDYDATERILIRMVRGWDTKLSPEAYKEYKEGKL